MADSRIRFHYLVKGFGLRRRTELKQFIEQMLRKQGKKVEHLNYIFCSDQYLLNLNQQYLKHNTYTDIVTFELSPPGAPLLSDIYISVERVKENAKAFNTPFYRELHRVIFHGALHLCGYKDKSPEDKKLMRTKEELYLKRFFT